MPSKTFGNTIEEIIDNIIYLIVLSFVTEITVARTLAGAISQYKWKLLLFIVGVITIVCSVILSVFSKLSEILSDPLMLIEKVSAQDFISAPNYIGLPEELRDYIESGFIDSGTPNSNPLGGNDMEYFNVTAGFLDPSYTMSFGRFHYAIDIVPSSNYFEFNKAYKIFNDVVMFATCSGNATSNLDSSGANYITLICDGDKYMAIFVHNKYNFIGPNESVRVIAGQPIAVMGSTGNSTGPHIHYQIKNLETGQILNPLSFIDINTSYAIVRSFYYEL